MDLERSGQVSLDNVHSNKGVERGRTCTCTHGSLLVTVALYGHKHTKSVHTFEMFGAINARVDVTGGTVWYVGLPQTKNGRADASSAMISGETGDPSSCSASSTEWMCRA